MNGLLAANFMKKGLLIFIGAVFLFTCYAKGQQPVSEIPDTIYNDFETGELFGWEPYPYAQDIGYDGMFSTHSNPTYNNSRYALGRPVDAHEAAELYQGFTKRLDIWSTPETRLQAEIYFQSDRDPGTLKISLGTFDGTSYSYLIDSPKANTWLAIDIPLEKFQHSGQPLVAGKHIQVVTIESKYKQTYNLYTYTILMDNFRINGMRQRRFVGVDPVSTDFDMFNTSILDKHFFYGDTIGLSVVPEGNIALDGVQGTLIDAKGKIVKDHIPFKKQPAGWTNNSIYRLDKQDARGQWEIRLAGKTAQGSEVQWSFKFLMPGDPITGYPRLFFSKDGLKDRLATEKSPVAKGILAQALADTGFMKLDVTAITEGKDRTGEVLVGGPYAKYAAGFDAMRDWLRPIQVAENILKGGSFRYAFTGDVAAGQKAKEALLRICAFSQWNNDWMLNRKFLTYYPVGFLLMDVAYGYDMLHDLLTEQQRQFVRQAIIDKGLKPFYRDMVEMNRMPSNMTNHIAVIVAGYGLAAMAIYGEDPDNPYLEPYLSSIITKAKTFIDRTYYKDGSYNEPKSGYMYMATRAIVELLASLDRNFGVDYTTTTSLQDFYKFPLQASSGTGRMQDYGDGGGANGGHISLNQIAAEWLVHRCGNPYLFNYVMPSWKAGKGGYFGYLWYRDDIKPISRDVLPPSKVFSAQGLVMRSGWDDRSTIISTHTGPATNHYHTDQGSFQIMTNDETLLTDPGVGAGGYYANTFYRIYNIQAIAHNVMLVDYDPESQIQPDFDNGIAALSTWPTMVHSFVGKGTDEVQEDLACVYKDKLDQYVRTLIYQKDGPLFLFDRVKSKSSEGHIYNWVFHAPQNDNHQRSIQYKDNQLTVDRPKARLTLEVLSPDIVESKTEDRDRDNESFTMLTSKPGLAQVNFFAVMVPEALPDQGGFGPRPKIEAMHEPGWAGAKVDQQGNNKLYVGFFRTGSDASDSVDGFSTDATQFTASLDRGGAFLGAYFRGKHFSYKGFAIKSDSPLTCEMNSGTSGTALTTEADQEVNLSVTMDHKPSAVSLNDQANRDWHYSKADHILTVRLPKGENSLLIK